jgi:hypothetical protein
MSGTDRHTPYQPRPVPRTPKEQQERREAMAEVLDAEIDRMVERAPYERY